jgi:hypothetical protein
METILNRDGPFQWDPSTGIPPFQLPVATKHRHHTTRDQRRDIKMASQILMHNKNLGLYYMNFLFN